MQRHLQKATLITLALLGLLALAACASTTSKDSANPPALESTATALANLPALGSTPAASANSPALNYTPLDPVGPSPAASETDISDSVTLTYDPADGSLLKADSQGLFRWRAGNGWEEVNLPQASGLSAVVVNPDQPAIVYASGPDLGVIRSDDGGATWQVINTGLPSLDVTALALHSFRRETLFSWLKDTGAYRTEDGGKNWVKVPDAGPPDKDVRSLTHSTLPGSMNTGWLYAVTPTGVYLSMDCF